MRVGNCLLSLILKVRMKYREGLFKFYYESGRLKAKSFYHNGELGGHTVIYREDGSIEMEADLKPENKIKELEVILEIIREV